MSQQQAPLPPALPLADPAPLGLGGFALTTFVLSVHNANWAPDLVWVGLALFYGGLAQFIAGQHEFKNRNVFGATAFSTYGAFWMSLAAFVIMDLLHALPATMNIHNALGWFIVAFTIFNTYMLAWSTRLSKAVYAVFLTLEITLILYFIGQFLAGSGHIAGTDLIHVSGYTGVLTAACAWYASAAGVINGMTDRPVLKVGKPLWSGPIGAAR
jgi:succinate-acetate transporter protein